MMDDNFKTIVTEALATHTAKLDNIEKQLKSIDSSLHRTNINQGFDQGFTTPDVATSTVGDDYVPPTFPKWSDYDAPKDWFNAAWNKTWFGRGWEAASTTGESIDLFREAGIRVSLSEVTIFKASLFFLSISLTKSPLPLFIARKVNSDATNLNPITPLDKPYTLLNIAGKPRPEGNTICPPFSIILSISF